MMQDVFVFGGGAWGQALAHVFAHKNNVFILSRRDLGLGYYRAYSGLQTVVSDMKQNGETVYAESTKQLPNDKMLQIKIH